MYLMTNEQLMSCMDKASLVPFSVSFMVAIIDISGVRMISTYVHCTYYGNKEWVLKFSIGLSKINFDSWRIENFLNGSPDLIL